MGQEYQAMAFLLDLAHYEWSCTFTIQQQLEIPTARSWAAPVRAACTERRRQAIRPVHHLQKHTCRVTLLQPTRRAVLGQPSSLRPH
jgi:hypothetical protein